MRKNDIARWMERLLPILVFCAVIAAFSPALENGFVGWDDDVYLLTNHSFRGLGLAQLRWMFTTRYYGLYQPLTWLSFGLDYKLWGLEPWGYHLTNILLHGAAAVFFYFVCLRLFEKAAPKADRDARVLGALAASLAFAVHPLRVDSVAWVAERKDVLSGLLLLASVWAYLEERIAVSWGLFALSLGAKVSGLFLPVALLGLDVYPLRRPGRWREKIPFFLLAAAAATATVTARAEMIHAQSFARINAAWRVGQVFYGLAEYTLKTLWPAGLCAYYPPRPWFGQWLPYAAPLAACGLAAGWALWSARKRSPAVAAAAGWSVLALAPVSGIVQHGVTYSVFDRYTYLPSLGGASLLGGAVMLACLGGRRLASAALAVVLIVWGALTWRQTLVWRDSLTLWSRAARLQPSALAFDNLAVAQGAAGQASAAVVSDQRALSLDPTYFKAYLNLGLAYQSLGRHAEAEQAWRRGLAVEPNTPMLLSLLGEQLCTDEKDDRCRSEGLSLLKRAVELGDAGKRDALAAAMARTGDIAGARRVYGEALSSDAEDPVAHVNLGLLLDAAGRPEEARSHYRLALRSQDQRAAAHADWGNSLLAQGRLDQAAVHYAEALRIDPGLVPAQVNLGNVLVRRGRYAEAAARYRAALKKDPGSFEARANLSALRTALAR